MFIVKVNRLKSQLESANKEALRLKSYHHKNIVRYVDSFMDSSDYGKVHWLIMENCNGGELRGFLKEHAGKKENTEVYIKYFSDIIEGLVEIHGRKQMHRDLKPENIFILILGNSAIDHVLKLGDFGLMKDVDSTMMSAASKGVGSGPYMSPE